MNLRIYENLCESNETVLRLCRDLKNNVFLHDYFIRNGFVKIITQAGDRPTKIRHPDILREKFDEYFQQGD